MGRTNSGESSQWVDRETRPIEKIFYGSEYTYFPILDFPKLSRQINVYLILG